MWVSNDMLQTKGESYRLNEKCRPGLLGGGSGPASRREGGAAPIMTTGRGQDDR